MAAKKRTTVKSGAASGTKAGTKRGGVKKRSGDVAVASETSPKSATPKAGKKGATKKAAGVKKAPVKLNDRQTEILKKVHAAGEEGYEIAQKTEQRTLEALRERKLIRRGAKNKETGNHRYTVSKAGQKHVESGGEGAK